MPMRLLVAYIRTLISAASAEAKASCSVSYGPPIRLKRLLLFIVFSPSSAERVSDCPVGPAENSIFSPSPEKVPSPDNKNDRRNLYVRRAVFWLMTGKGLTFGCAPFLVEASFKV